MTKAEFSNHFFKSRFYARVVAQRGWAELPDSILGDMVDSHSALHAGELSERVDLSADLISSEALFKPGFGSSERFAALSGELSVAPSADLLAVAEDPAGLPRLVNNLAAPSDAPGGPGAAKRGATARRYRTL
eukprot:Selendium_serpulae@DN11793_c0_g1_i1.p2